MVCYWCLYFSASYSSPILVHKTKTAYNFTQHIYLDNIEIIDLYLANGYDVHKEGPFATPLRSASLMGHESVVRYLIPRGADVNVQTPLLGDALQAAAMKGHLSITKILLHFHAKVGNDGGFFGNAL